MEIDFSGQCDRQRDPRSNWDQKFNRGGYSDTVAHAGMIRSKEGASRRIDMGSVVAAAGFLARRIGWRQGRDRSQRQRAERPNEAVLHRLVGVQGGVIEASFD
jgi:hypothetical protein